MEDTIVQVLKIQRKKMTLWSLGNLTMNAPQRCLALDVVLGLSVLSMKLLQPI